MCPQRKKSIHMRSGDVGGQDTGPPRPIHRFPMVALRWFLTAMLKWAGVIFIHRPVYQMHVSHFNMCKPFLVHCCHKAVMIATESVCFQTDLRAVLNVSTHSQSATPTQQLTSAPLTKWSLTLQIDFRDHMFLIEIYLFWCSLLLVLIRTNSFGRLCISSWILE